MTDEPEFPEGAEGEWALCEFCGHPLKDDEVAIHEVCAGEMEAEWRHEHEREARYGA